MNATHAKGRRSSALSLTETEARYLRYFVQNLAAKSYGGSIDKLAKALGVAPRTLAQTWRPSPALVVALWRLTRAPTEAMLEPGPRPVLVLPPAQDGGAP